MHVAVGSKNPVKIQAVRQAFVLVWPEIAWVVEGVEVPSGVKAQPMSDRESIRGATNRARRALRALKADFGVGLEGGLQKIGSEWFDCGWIVVLDKKGTKGIGSSLKIQTPPAMIELILTGKELGEVCDLIFQKENTKQGDGHFGLMTNKAITRTEGYTHGVISALSRFLHPQLFE